MSTIEKALKLTSSFEGGGSNPFDNLSGNFDGMGVSFGCLQWNFGSGTLQPLIKRMASDHPVEFKKACTVFVKAYNKDMDLSSELLQVCAMSATEAIEWCKARQNPQDHSFTNAGYPHWAQVFLNLGSDPVLQQEQITQAHPYLKSAKDALTQFGFHTERGFCLMFDIMVQLGSISAESHTRYHQYLATNPPHSEVDNLVALAHSVAPQGGQWQADVLSRKLTIAQGQGTVHGRTINLEHDFGITLNPAELPEL